MSGYLSLRFLLVRLHLSSLSIPLLFLHVECLPKLSLHFLLIPVNQILYSSGLLLDLKWKSLGLPSKLQDLYIIKFQFLCGLCSLPRRLFEYGD